MPTFSFSTSDVVTLTPISSSAYNAMRNDIKGFFNTTKLTSTNVQDQGLTSTNLSTVIQSKTAGYQILSTDDVILCDGTATSFTVTLPAATVFTGKKLIIKKIDSSTSKIITISRAGSDTIEGKNSVTLNSLYEEITLISDGTSVWYVQNFFKNPTFVSFLSSTGTYNPPNYVRRLRVRALGGGGGGGGSGGGGAGGGTGGTTTLGTSILTCVGGVGGGASGTDGGTGGAATISGSAVGITVIGGAGSSGGSLANTAGGSGAASALGGQGGAGNTSAAGTASAVNTGAGGGGGGGFAATAAASGGGSGGYVDAIIVGATLATWITSGASYGVGAAGTAGAGAGGGFNGGAGGSGGIWIEEYYS